MLEPGSIPAALLGGGMIGFAAALLMALNGRVLGVSGIAAGIVMPGAPLRERLERGGFLLGMICGGILLAVSLPQALPDAYSHDRALLISAGLLVGFGTRLGSGCTSGHGVCGIARLSPRSLVATALFMASGIATVFVVRHLLGDAS
jgi:uncharacterized membrane protein YedE/YeeE